MPFFCNVSLKKGILVKTLLFYWNYWERW